MMQSTAQPSEQSSEQSTMLPVTIPEPLNFRPTIFRVNNHHGQDTPSLQTNPPSTNNENNFDFDFGFKDTDIDESNSKSKYEQTLSGVTSTSQAADDDEPEIIYELDEAALAKLPLRLQITMREIQLDRVREAQSKQREIRFRRMKPGLYVVNSHPDDDLASNVEDLQVWVRYMETKIEEDKAMLRAGVARRAWLEMDREVRQMERDMEKKKKERMEEEAKDEAAKARSFQSFESSTPTNYVRYPLQWDPAPRGLNVQKKTAAEVDHDEEENTSGIGPLPQSLQTGVATDPSMETEGILCPTCPFPNMMASGAGGKHFASCPLYQHTPTAVASLNEGSYAATSSLSDTGYDYTAHATASRAEDAYSTTRLPQHAASPYAQGSYSGRLPLINEALSEPPAGPISGASPFTSDPHLGSTAPPFGPYAGPRPYHPSRTVNDMEYYRYRSETVFPEYRHYVYGPGAAAYGGRLQGTQGSTQHQNKVTSTMSKICGCVREKFQKMSDLIRK